MKLRYTLLPSANTETFVFARRIFPTKALRGVVVSCPRPQYARTRTRIEVGRVWDSGARVEHGTCTFNSVRWPRKKTRYVLLGHHSGVARIFFLPRQGTIVRSCRARAERGNLLLGIVTLLTSGTERAIVGVLPSSLLAASCHHDFRQVCGFCKHSY